MTQAELDKLYEYYTDEETYDPDEGCELYHKKLNEMDCDMITCDWKEYGRVVPEFIELLEELGCTVLEDPWYEGSDSYGWVIFKPKKEE